MSRVSIQLNVSFWRGADKWSDRCLPISRDKIYAARALAGCEFQPSIPTNILITVDAASAMQAVPASFLWSRNPIPVVGVSVQVIRLKATNWNESIPGVH
jgi:hypothetical protein